MYHTSLIIFEMKIKISAIILKATFEKVMKIVILVIKLVIYWCLRNTIYSKYQKSQN